MKTNDRIKEPKFTNTQKKIIDDVIKTMDKEFKLLDFYPDLIITPLSTDIEVFGEADPPMQHIRIMPVAGTTSFKDTVTHECFHLLIAACQGMYDDKEDDLRAMEEKIVKILTKYAMMPKTTKRKD